ncbi:MAG: hypothetical protein IT379_03050 [Deltaproteobacteria bacterium]|nr:hypothetical protein [Deltaproteobacteria bacterium]
MCDTLVIVREGSVLFAKSSDRDPNEGQGLEWHPRRQNGAGTRVRCTWIEIPEAPVTHAVLISRPFWMWGAEMGTNEHGVTIGNEAVFTDQPYAKVGLTSMDLLRLALERAATADEAVRVIEDLLARHGQGGGCGHENRSFTYHGSFLVADAAGAFVVETAGRLVAVEPVRAGVRAISNGLTIAGFAERHADRLRGRAAACAVRRARTQTSAARVRTPIDLVRTLRDHGHDGGPRYGPLRGGMAAPCMHAGGLALSSQTTGSWIAELRPGRTRHWVTATAAPCTSVFKPVEPTVPRSLGPFPGERADDSLFWSHERIHRAAMRAPREALAWIDATRAPIERRAFDADASADDVWRDALAWERSAREHARIWLAARDRRPPWARLYWAIRDRRASV